MQIAERKEPFVIAQYHLALDRAAVISARAVLVDENLKFSLPKRGSHTAPLALFFVQRKSIFAKFHYSIYLD